MISLRDKIVNEGILDSTRSGKEGLKKQVEEWIEDNNIKDATINPDCSVTIGGNVRFGKNVIKGAIPDYIVLNSVQDLTITETDSLKNMPKNAVVLTITNSSIDNFEDVNMDYCESFRVFNCDIKSLKGLPKDCNSLYIGNNKQHFTKKEIKKFVNTKPNYIYTLGYYSLKFYDLLLGQNDVNYCSDELDKLEKMYKKSVPELDHMVFSGCKEDNTTIYMKLDFLPKSEHVNGIAENSIYLQFAYNVDDCSLEYRQSGHLNLTDKDRAGKYKYYALKGFTAPYYDTGGKKFRKTRLDDFNAEAVYLKTIDWIRNVVMAALEDQGGVLKRRG